MVWPLRGAETREDLGTNPATVAGHCHHERKGCVRSMKMVTGIDENLSEIAPVKR